MKRSGHRKCCGCSKKKAIGLATFLAPATVLPNLAPGLPEGAHKAFRASCLHLCGREIGRERLWPCDVAK